MQIYSEIEDILDGRKFLTKNSFSDLIFALEMIDLKCNEIISKKILEKKESINKKNNLIFIKDLVCCIAFLIFSIIFHFYINFYLRERYQNVNFIFKLIPYQFLWNSAQIRTHLKLNKNK